MAEMIEHEKRVDRISSIVTAYDKLMDLFYAFISGWQDSDKAIGVKAAKSRDGDLSLCLFDGKKASIVFSLVINHRGDPWGKIAFTVGDKAVSAVYFDSQGYLHDRPQRNRDGKVPPLLMHPYQQNVLVARFMEAYLELFQEDREQGIAM